VFLLVAERTIPSVLFCHFVLSCVKRSYRVILWIEIVRGRARWACVQESEFVRAMTDIPGVRRSTLIVCIPCSWLFVSF
jgi:hypothetical protein